MTFDTEGFKSEKFEHRTKKVPVPNLKAWFKDGAKPVWTVRGLTAVEIAQANDAAAGRNVSTAILEGLLTRRASEVKDAVEKLVGRADDVPEEMARRIEHIRIASIDPVCDEDLVLKLSKVEPTYFYTLANEIWNLSGQGMSPKKSKPFGKTKQSKTS